MNIVYPQDNIEGLKQLAPNSFDLAIIDPPYGLKEDGRKKRPHLALQKNGASLRVKRAGHTPQNWDNCIPTPEFWQLLFNVSFNQIIFGGNYFPEIVTTPFKPPRRKYFQQFLIDNPNGWIIWDKVNGTNDFNDCELIWTSFNRPSYVLPYMWHGMMQAKSIEEPYTQQGNKRLNEKRIHPTHKPLIIYRKLLSDYAKGTDTILDTHVGSGSIRIACDEYGLSFTGFESNITIWDKQEKRWQEYKMVQRLPFT